MAVEIITYPPIFSHANLQTYWRLEGNSNDSKGSNNGTDANITYNSGNGLFGQGAGFNGSSSKITFANPSVGANFTIMGWVKPAGNLGTTTQSLFDTYPSGLGSLRIYGSGDGRLNYEMGGEGARYSSAIGDWTGAWHHVALIQSGSSTRRIVVDGVDFGSHTEGNGTSTTLILGNLNAGQWFSGAMDEWVTFNTNLSVAEIKTYYDFSIANKSLAYFM